MGESRMSDNREEQVEVHIGDDVPREVKKALERHEEDVAQQQRYFSQADRTHQIVVFIRIMFIIMAFVLGIVISAAFFWWGQEKCEPIVIQGTNGSSSNETMDVPVEKESLYGVVFDMGSGGSRGYVYTWKEGERMILGPEEGPPSWWMRIQGGVSTFPTPEEAANSLIPILDFCQQKLEEVNADLGKVPIFLLGTAGLRSLSPTDAEERMEAIRDLVETYPFYFERQFAEILTDTQEGTYEWRSTQYLLGTLSLSSRDLCEFYGVGNSLVDCESYSTSTVGVLGIGGQSAQASFCSEDRLGVMPEDVTKMGYQNCDYLYVSSDFVGFEHATFKYTLPNLISQSGTDLFEQEVPTLSHPCLHTGFETSVKTFTDGGEEVTIQLVGNSDYQACLSLLETVLEEKDIGPLIDDFSMIFLSAGSNSRRLREFFGLNFMYRPIDLKHRASSFCSLDWLTVMSLYGKDGGPEIVDAWSGNSHELIDYCPQALWMYSLQKKLGFHDTRAQNLVTSEIQGYFSDWTTAALLSHLPLYPPIPLPALQ